MWVEFFGSAPRDDQPLPRPEFVASVARHRPPPLRTAVIRAARDGPSVFPSIVSNERTVGLPGADPESQQVLDRKETEEEIDDAAGACGNWR